MVEAKAHTEETITKCKATAEDSKRLIKQSLMSTHELLAVSDHIYDESLWFSRYYQLANRLTFLNNLTSQGIKVKLILLNIVDDPTYIKTSEDKWIKHYSDVFQKMLGTSTLPNNVYLLNINVG